MKNYISTTILTFVLLLPQEVFSFDYFKAINNINANISAQLSDYNPLIDGILIRKSRRSFGGSRSRSRSRARTKSRSNAQQKRAKQKAVARKREAAKKPSFGGSRMKSAAAKKKYGTPRRTTQMTGKSASGVQQNYNVHHYGGYGSGLMTGYMMGSAMWYWSTPFHPAYYYSKPVYVENSNGKYDVYPPSISYSKIFIVIAILAVIVYFIRKRKKRSSDNDSVSSFT